MIGLRPILSDSQPKKMKNGVPIAQRRGDHDVGRRGIELQRLGEEEQGVELARVPHHRLAGGAAEQGEDRDLGVLPPAEGLAQRRLGALALRLDAGEGRRLLELQADPDRHAEQDDRQQERDAPAPLGELLRRHREPQAQDDEQRQEQADRGRGLDPRGVEAAAVLRRVLGDVGRGTAILAAQRQALQQAAGDEQHGGSDADRGVARQQADHEGRDAHQGHRHEEGVLAADQVAQAAEEQRAERTDREAGGEAQQGEDEGRRRIDAREEGGADVRGERAGEIEVVPFEDGADRGGDDDLPLLAGHRPTRCSAGSSCHRHMRLLLLLGEHSSRI